MIGILLLLQAMPQAPPQPRRTVPDSGVIATTAQVTPAGVQSVFGARVTGVRFGKRPGEIWVSANWAAYRLDCSFEARFFEAIVFQGQTLAHKYQGKVKVVLRKNEWGTEIEKIEIPEFYN